MLKDLLRNYKKIMNESETQTRLIEKEIEKLHLKRQATIQAMNDIKTALPSLKSNYEKFAKAFGIKANEITKKHMKTARETFNKAVENYKKLLIELDEIDQSLIALSDEMEQSLSNQVEIVEEQ